MPCWKHEAHLATLSNTWFLCDDCREAIRFADDVAKAFEALEVGTSTGALAESPSKAGSGPTPTLTPHPQSPPPGAQPERDPVLDSYPPFSEGEGWTLVGVEISNYEWDGERLVRRIGGGEP